MKKILYIKHADSSFVQSDQKILERQYRVVPYLINQKKTGIFYLFSLLDLSWFILRNARGTTAMVTWFGDYHSAILSFFGKIFHIRVVIIAGGQEAICYPELKKGVYFNKWRGRLTGYALRQATLIVPNHASLIEHENFYYDPAGKKDGIRYYNPGIKTPMVIIPNGIDPLKYYRDERIPKIANRVLTVGTMNGPADFLNKGFDLFIEMAHRNPGMDCVLIGIKKVFMPWIETRCPMTGIPNLTLVYSYCPEELLFQQYNMAKVFVQASITEGMPNTLNEAMLCECIPVGSHVNGIPDAIGDTGIIIERRDFNELETAVRKALTLGSGAQARSHILQNYTLQLREERLLTLLHETIGL